MRNFYIQDEAFCFNISISDRCYDHKPTPEDYKAMTFHVENLNADELLDRIREGYSICHIFKNNRRIKNNFMYTNEVFIDVDDSTVSMEEVINACELKPTLGYTTFSDGKHNLHRFRLIYIFGEAIRTEEGYKCMYYKLLDWLHLESNKDNCGSSVTQLMNGNSSENIRVFSQHYIYDNNTFLQNCHLELYITTPPPKQYNSDRQFCKNEMTNEDLCAIQELKKGISDFLSKYAYIPIINETSLEYNENGYALYPQLYYRLNIRIDWSNQKHKVLKYKDGECRRKRLYIDTLIMRAIKPKATFIELLYNLVLRRKCFYDNSDKVLTDEILINDVQTVLNMSLDEIYSLNPSKHGAFKTDAIYCQLHGVSRRQHSMTIRKLLNYQSIGEWYDVSMSVNQNHKFAKENGIKVSLNTLKNFCRENSVDMHPDTKPIEKWYDETQSVKKNLEWAKENEIKVSQT